MNLKEIQIRNYKATVKRGLISQNTTFEDFINKLEEEVNELNLSELPFVNEVNVPFFDERELADVVLVCLAMAKHYNVDILKELENKTLINEERAKNGK